MILRRLADQTPGDQILALIEQHLTAALVVPAGNDAAISSVRLLPELGVAEMLVACAGGQVLGGDDRVARELRVVQSVAEGKVLGLYLLPPAVTGDLVGHAGVHQRVPSVRQGQSGAGKAAAVVIGHIRGQGCGEVFPVQQVAADRVAPVHRPPVGIVGVILVKQVVLTVVEGKAVRVVHPAHAGREMEGRPILRHDKGALVGFIVPRVQQGAAERVQFVHGKDSFQSSFMLSSRASTMVGTTFVARFCTSSGA